jgi:hypothetical protein
MSLAKAAPDGLKDRECKKMALHKCPLIPYVPEKDSVQEMVSSYKDNHLKTLIKKGTDLRVPIWHSGTCKAFLIHVGSVQGAKEKKSYFNSFEEYSETYADKREKIKELKDQLMALKEASETSAETSGQSGTSRKSNKNPKETTVEASKEGSATLRATIKAELKQALEAVEDATMKRDKVAEDMFQLYANLLSVNARYAWNKIVQEQTNTNPYRNLQGLTRKGPRGMLRKSFEDCVTIHLLNVFPNYAAEQERYYITNVLKKPQRVSIRQFVQHVEQLNSYILQLPCWYYSLSVKANTIPMNVPFAKADLLSHIFRMCPYAWQDQYDLHEKGGTPVDMRSLLLSLEAIKRVCSQERSNKSNPSRDKKASHSKKKGTK